MELEWDEHDYPTEDTLKAIRDWPVERWWELLEQLEAGWCRYGSWKRTRRRLRLATGGWSGNEDIIGELRGTWLWWLAWESHHRGGLYIFDLSTLYRLARPPGKAQGPRARREHSARVDRSLGASE